MMKNTMAAVPYMMPMRLWSIVVTQARQPVVVVGRANTPMGDDGRAGTDGPPGRASGPPAGVSVLAGRRSDIAVGLLRERVEVGDQLTDLILGQLQVGHTAAPPVRVGVVLGEGRHGLHL